MRTGTEIHSSHVLTNRVIRCWLLVAGCLRCWCCGVAAAAKLGGFFTSLKKEVLTIGQTKTTDLHFDTAKTNYDSFVAAVNMLKSHVDVWNASTRGMCVNAELVAVDYKHAMQTTNT